MDGELILYSVLVLFIVFIFIVPALLYGLLKKMTDPVPVYLPLILSGLVLVLLTGIRISGIISGNDVLTGTVVMFLFMLLLVDLAVIAPYPYFAGRIRTGKTWLVFTLPALIGASLFFYTTAGEAYYGRPMPPFSAPLPLTGWILDLSASLSGTQDAVYAFGSPLYPLLEASGLYFEVILIAVICYWIMSMNAIPENGKLNGQA